MTNNSHINMRFRQLRDHVNITDTMALWAIRETAAILPLDQLVTERGGTYFTRALINAAAHVTGTPRDAILTCAATRRDRVVELLWTHYRVGPALRDRRNKCFKDIRQLKETRITADQVAQAAHHIGPVTIGRFLAQPKPFAASCVEKAITADPVTRNHLAMIAAAGPRTFRCGSPHFANTVTGHIQAAGPNLVKAALQNRRSVHTVLASYAAQADSNNDTRLADALYALSVTHASLIRQALPDHRTLPEINDKEGAVA